MQLKPAFISSRRIAELHFSLSGDLRPKERTPSRSRLQLVVKSVKGEGRRWEDMCRNTASNFQETSGRLRNPSSAMQHA